MHYNAKNKSLHGVKTVQAFIFISGLLCEGAPAKRVGGEAMIRLSPSVPAGHRSPSGTSCHLPCIGGVCLAEGAGKSGRLYKDPCPHYTEINTTKGAYP